MDTDRVINTDVLSHVACFHVGEGFLDKTTPHVLDWVASLDCFPVRLYDFEGMSFSRVGLARGSNVLDRLTACQDTLRGDQTVVPCCPHWYTLISVLGVGQHVRGFSSLACAPTFVRVRFVAGKFRKGDTFEQH